MVSFSNTEKGLGIIYGLRSIVFYPCKLAISRNSFEPASGTEECISTLKSDHSSCIEDSSSSFSSSNLLDLEVSESSMF